MQLAPLALQKLPNYWIFYLNQFILVLFVFTRISVDMKNYPDPVLVTGPEPDPVPVI